MSDFPRIAVVGAGAWGTALANAVARERRNVSLLARDAAHAAEMAASQENRRRLPGIALAASIAPTASWEALERADLVILATPAQSVRAIAPQLAEAVSKGAPVVSTAKGIERDSGLYPSDILTEALPDSPIAVLSGPSFATDVARSLPTAVVLAAVDDKLAKRIAESLSAPTFRLYHGTDVRGVEIGGAAKNVLAIGAGVVAGAGLGESARAALVARGFAELQRFASAIGGKPETLMGLSGLGDLVLTCGSARSRNFSFGEALGRGRSAAEAGARALAEGAATADILVRLAREKNIDMPVSAAVADLVAGRATVEDAVAALMARPLRAEM